MNSLICFAKIISSAAICEFVEHLKIASKWYSKLHGVIFLFFVMNNLFRETYRNFKNFFLFFCHNEKTNPEAQRAPAIYIQLNIGSAKDSWIFWHFFFELMRFWKKLFFLQVRGHSRKLMWAPRRNLDKIINLFIVISKAVNIS